MKSKIITDGNQTMNDSHDSVTITMTSKSIGAFLYACDYALLVWCLCWAWFWVRGRLWGGLACVVMGWSERRGQQQGRENFSRLTKVGEIVVTDRNNR
jgi:hypothetical protein